MPYSRVTNIDVVQGLIPRLFKLASIRIQTAGYSYGYKKAEAEIIGLKNFEEVKNMILKLVKEVKLETFGVYGEAEERDVNKLILMELRKIREILEGKQIK